MVKDLHPANKALEYAVMTRLPPVQSYAQKLTVTSKIIRTNGQHCRMQ